MITQKNSIIKISMCMNNWCSHAASLGTLLGSRSYMPNRAENGLPDEKEYARKIANLEFDKTYFYIFGEDGVSEGKQDLAEVINYYSLYPNPSNNIIEIEGNFSRISNIELLSSSGNIIKVFKATDLIDISTIPRGLYVMIINTKDGSHEVHKVVIY